jgi:hypothetical protein
MKTAGGHSTRNLPIDGAVKICQNWDSIHFWGLGKDGPKKIILKFSELSLE